MKSRQRETERTLRALLENSVITQLPGRSSIGRGTHDSNTPLLQYSNLLRFVPLLDPLIQGLKHARVHRGDDVHRRIEFLFRHASLPCVRKATIHSRVAQPHHRNGEANQHLLSFSETVDRMRITIKSSKVSFLQSHGSCQTEGTASAKGRISLNSHG
jgi:hypothetical protein